MTNNKQEADMPELKPCPNLWCKSVNPPIVHIGVIRDGADCRCVHCGMFGPWCATEAEAITAWNTRPDDYTAGYAKGKAEAQGWNLNMDEAPYETPVETVWMGSKTLSPVVVADNTKNSGGNLGKRDWWWKSKPAQTPTYWRRTILPTPPEPKGEG